MPHLLLRRERKGKHAMEEDCLYEGGVFDTVLGRFSVEPLVTWRSGRKRGVVMGTCGESQLFRKEPGEEGSTRVGRWGRKKGRGLDKRKGGPTETTRFLQL